MRAEEDRIIGGSKTTGRGMHNSKFQGGRDFDREKDIDKFERSEEREEKEEDLHGTGQGTAYGFGSTKGPDNNSPVYYSGSQQDRATEGQHKGVKGRDL